MEDVQNHGLGLKSVSRIISNYNGTIKMYYDSSQKVFHTIILLNNA
ncbi:GHKL domain-containing protein [Ruminococcus sp. AM16-34]|nr:GHKL domain-containing protein [Ruminococcus sp. AM16-34]